MVNANASKSIWSTGKLTLRHFGGGTALAEDGALSASASRRTSVLVVDGNPVGREFMRAILVSLGADVTLVGTLADAVVRAEERRFALALIDVRLPDGDGRELAIRLRAIQPDLRIVAATGGSAEASAAIAEGLFSGLLQKPIDPRALGRLLNDTREIGDKS